MRGATKAPVLGWLALASLASAQVGNTCPSTEVCFKLNIPQDTASSGTGDIFFQITAPLKYEWVALGQGHGMANSNMFLIYTSSSGNNVTLSPRTGTGHTPPKANTAARVTLLEGSTVSNGVMTANVKCSNCNSWSGGAMDFTASSGNWIYGWQASGGPKNSDDTDAQINQHSSEGVFSWNFAQAKGGSSVNPFVSSTSTGNTGGSSNNSGSSSNSGSSANNGGPSNFTPVSSTGGFSKQHKMLIAHGVLASLAFVIFFPMGSIAIRLVSMRGIAWLHGAFQIFGYAVYIAGAGLGIYLAKDFSLLNHHHPIIGMVLLGVLFFQPALGWLHHLFFKKTQTRTVWSHAHIWLGRLAITLGIINGGLGLQLAGHVRLSSRAGKIVYGVVAALIWLAWVASMVIGESRRKRAPVAHAAEPKLTGERSDSDRGLQADASRHHEPMQQ